MTNVTLITGDGIGPEIATGGTLPAVGRRFL